MVTSDALDICHLFNDLPALHMVFECVYVLYEHTRCTWNAITQIIFYMPLPILPCSFHLVGRKSAALIHHKYRTAYSIVLYPNEHTLVVGHNKLCTVHTHSNFPPHSTYYYCRVHLNRWMNFVPYPIYSLRFSLFRKRFVCVFVWESCIWLCRSRPYWQHSIYLESRFSMKWERESDCAWERAREMREKHKRRTCKLVNYQRNA